MAENKIKIFEDRNVRVVWDGNELVTNCNQLKMPSPKDGKNIKPML